MSHWGYVIEELMTSASAPLVAPVSSENSANRRTGRSEWEEYLAGAAGRLRFQRPRRVRPSVDLGETEPMNRSTGAAPHTKCRCQGAIEHSRRACAWFASGHVTVRGLRRTLCWCRP